MHYLYQETEDLLWKILRCEMNTIGTWFKPKLSI